LAILGLIVTDKLTTEVIVGWFDQHPEIPATKESIMNFVQHPKVKPRLRWKSESRMKFESVASRLTPTELDVLDAFMKSNRLHHGPDDDRTFSNGYSLIVNNHGRPWNPHVLGTWTLPQSFGSLKWVERAADPNKRYGQHSGNNAHLAPRTESNVSFSHRVANQNTQIPRPAPASAKMDAYQWDRLASSLVGERHSDTATIQQAVTAAGGGEAGYRAGLAMQKKIRMDRERGR